MTDIMCTMECGHTITWGESPETPGADLPWLTRTVFCPECEADKDIVDCDPVNVAVETVAARGFDRPAEDEFETQVHTFRSLRDGTWGYSISSQKSGLWAESDDTTGYESRQDALDAALASLDEQRRIDAEYKDMDAAAEEENRRYFAR